MNSTEKLLKCIVCQKSVDALKKNTCAKGHIQCQECVDVLDGACGLCDLPMEHVELPISKKVKDELVVEVVDNNEVKEKEKPLSKEIKEGEIDTRVEGKLKVIFKENIEGSEIGDQYGDTALAKNSFLSTVFEMKTESVENVTDEEITKEQVEETAILQPTAMEFKSTDTISNSLYNTLKELHKFTCQKKCRTFDKCVQKVLLQLIDENEKDMSTSADSVIRGNESIPDLLDSLHGNFCKINCDDIELCLNKQLEKIIKHYEATSEGEKTNNENTKTYSAVNSNVVRSIYRGMGLKSKSPMSQFEFITEFPRLKKTQTSSLYQLNLDKKFFDFDELQTLQCPLPNCATEVEITKTTLHLEDQHKNLLVERMAAGDCKTFFIDPSILEQHETNCLLCYSMTNSIALNKQRADLPIFLLVCRTSLSRIYASSVELSAEKSSTENSQSSEHESQTIQAQIDEAIFGSNRKLKRKPVLWSSEDVLIIWPIAPIPFNAAFKAVLSIFTQNQPICHRSVSFHMRSMVHSREPCDLFGAPDALTLMNVDVDALTSQGQHAIQCQIMCNF